LISQPAHETPSSHLQFPTPPTDKAQKDHDPVFNRPAEYAQV
jgi:hypothetical protein